MGRAAVIVEDVEHVRRLEAGAAPERTRIDLGGLVDEAVSSLAASTAERRIAIRVSRASAEVDVDRVLAVRAIANLVANAVRHSPGGADVEVSVEPDGDCAVVHIADRGPAVPDAEKRAVFEEYAPRSVRRGTGFGLHLAFLVAQAHRGSIEVRDRDGGGALLRLALPLARP
jgi:two-component system OmpR family sensor kinase